MKLPAFEGLAFSRDYELEVIEAPSIITTNTAPRLSDESGVGGIVELGCGEPWELEIPLPVDDDEGDTA